MITGIHHVTAIASDPQPNLDFYTSRFGFRLVKRTVNFDDPQTYHLYYGDEVGTPGTILTFFPWPAARRGRHGTSQVSATAFQSPADLRGEDAGERFGQRITQITDPDGLVLEVVAGEAFRIHSATLLEADGGRTAELLTGMMGMRQVGREGNRTRYATGDSFVDVVVDANAPRGLGGAGTVHHIAFRTPDDAAQLRWQQDLMAAGYHVSPVMDRKYFHSIYFREPGGILFEIATDPPGFAVDEPVESLGRALMLPDEYEPRRSEIEQVLPALAV